MRSLRSRRVGDVGSGTAWILSTPRLELTLSPFESVAPASLMILTLGDAGGEEGGECGGAAEGGGCE